MTGSAWVRRRLCLAIVGAGLVVVFGCGDDEAVGSTRLAPPPAPAAVAPPSGVGPEGESLSLEVVESAGIMLITDHRGFAVYGNERETPAALVCADADCTKVWLPLEPRDPAIAARLDRSKFDVILRPDGIEQVVYDQIPLYLWTGDSAVGVPAGSGVAGIWFALTADGVRVQ